ncbi:hypothetical protein [Nocardia asteroides]|uniref:hypothetical protein n=1 Tax=Nocardia asteroides TaxID=1824 RepID=UPI003427BCAF
MLTSTRKSGHWVAAAAIATMATAMASGTAQADVAVVPEPDYTSITSEIMPGVQYTGSLADGSVVISTPAGRLISQGTQFQLLDATGATVAGTPFAETPKAAAIAADIAKGVPTEVTTLAAAPVAGGPEMSPSDRFDQALAVAGGQFGLATGVGAMVGGLGGLIIGCVVGAATGGTIFTLVSLATLTVPAAVGGCLALGPVLSAVGAVVGGALLGIPVGINAYLQMQQKLNAPAVQQPAG